MNAYVVKQSWATGDPVYYGREGSVVTNVEDVVPFLHKFHAVRFVSTWMNRFVFRYVYSGWTRMEIIEL